MGSECHFEEEDVSEIQQDMLPPQFINRNPACHNNTSGRKWDEYQRLLKAAVLVVTRSEISDERAANGD